jgi:addiction module HigA family antidote
MKNHPHPGRIVRQDFLEPLGLTVTEAAKVLGVARQTINNLVNEKAGISAEMAVRLSKAFGPSPDMWVRLQANYDLSQVRQDEISVARYKRASWNRAGLYVRPMVDGRSGGDRACSYRATTCFQYPCLVQLPPPPPRGALRARGGGTI